MAAALQPAAGAEVPLPTCLADYAAAARHALDPNAAAYFLGSAADGLTAAANRAAWDRLSLLPRVLRGGPGGTAEVTLLGRRLAHPVIVGPVAFQRMAHAEGETGTALAAAAQGALMVLSCQSATAMEPVSRAGATCRWFQLYLQPLRAATLALVRRAEAAGFEALVVTVDAPLSGVRNDEMRAGFRLPPGIGAVNLQGLPQPVGGAPGDESPAASPVFDRFMAQAPGWDDIAWLRGQTDLPLVLKGILSPADARLAIQHGAAAVVVSNHGGRVLDTAVATARALPGVAAAVAGQVPVLVDGGIRRGTDVVKALALGASAVMIGRPVAEALAVGGARGVAHMLRILRDETEVAMALCGCARVGEITPDLLVGDGVPVAGAQ